MTRKFALALALGLITQGAAAAPVISDFVVYGATSVSIGSNTGAPVDAAIGSGGSITIQQNANVGDGDDAIIITGGGVYTGAQNGNYVGDIIFGGSVSLGQNSTVLGSVHSGGSVSTAQNVTVNGDVVAAGAISIGNGNNIGGDVHGGGSVVLGNNVNVGGTALAGGAVAVGSNVSVAGVVNGAPAPTPLAPPVIALPEANSFTAGGANKTVGNGGTLSLLADTYGALTVANNGFVSLSGGEYFFDSMTFGNNGVLELDLSLGAIIINIVGNLSIGNGFDIVLLGGDATDVLFEVHGNAAIGNGADWFGTLFAPDGKISFGNDADITGAIYGDIVQIGNNSRFSYATSSILFGGAGGPGPAPAEVAEPAALGVLGLGLLAIGIRRGRRRA